MPSCRQVCHSRRKRPGPTTRIVIGHVTSVRPIEFVDDRGARGPVLGRAFASIPSRRQVCHSRRERPPRVCPSHSRRRERPGPGPGLRLRGSMARADVGLRGAAEGRNANARAFGAQRERARFRGATRTRVLSGRNSTTRATPKEAPALPWHSASSRYPAAPIHTLIQRFVYPAAHSNSASYIQRLTVMAPRGPRVGAASDGPIHTKIQRFVYPW